MMNNLDIKDTLFHEYYFDKLHEIPKDLQKRNILFR